MGARRPDTGFVVDFFFEIKSILSLLASCDKCNYDQAYFYQLQIRSADEPMTTCKCSTFTHCSQKAQVRVVYRYVADLDSQSMF